MVSQLDIDAKRRLVHARNLAAFMLGFTVAAYAFPVVVPIAIGLNAFVWLTWFINKTATIRELSLLDQGDE